MRVSWMSVPGEWVAGGTHLWAEGALTVIEAKNGMREGAVRCESELETVVAPIDRRGLIEREEAGTHRK